MIFFMLSLKLLRYKLTVNYPYSNFNFNFIEIILSQSANVCNPNCKLFAICFKNIVMQQLPEFPEFGILVKLDAFRNSINW